MKVWSGISTSRSTSGSIRFSRSSNTSLKSSPRASDNSYRTGSEGRRYSPDKSALERSLHRPTDPGGPWLSSCSAGVTADITFPSIHLYHQGRVMQPTFHRGGLRSRRDIFNEPLDIPTTINEESSRSLRTPSPRSERAARRYMDFDFYDGKNNDIDWVESKMLESKLDSGFNSRRLKRDSYNLTNNNNSANQCSTQGNESKTEQSALATQVDTSGTKAARSKSSGDGVVTHTGGGKQRTNATGVPLIVTEHVEEPLPPPAQETVITLHKEEYRDSGAESDVEMSVSETDMLVSSEQNDSTIPADPCPILPQVFDINANSAAV